MIVYITDKNGHEASFDAPKFNEWHTENLILVLEGFVELLKAKSIEDSEIF